MNTTNEDILIGRVSANDASAEDWQGLERLAAEQPAVWEQLARALRDELTIRAALEDELSPADVVEIPARAFRPTMKSNINRWSGWALAAMVGVAWVSASMFQPRGGVNTGLPPIVSGDPGPIVPGNGGVQLVSNADEAYNQYKEIGYREGRFLDELPMIMIETRPSADGQTLEVFYVRRSLERAQITTVYELGVDEHGNRRTVPFTRDRLLNQSPDDSGL